MDQLEKFFNRGLKLSHLRVLTMFASLGQIRLVADRLSVTQPAISRQIAELEAGLGTPVVVRAGNRLQFTSVGEALVTRAREVLLQLEQARHEVDALCAGISGSIAVGAVATVLPVIAPELTLQLKKRAPNVSVSFFEATSDRLFPMLTRGALDMVFSRTEQPETNAGLSRARLFDDPIVIVCGAEHPLASRRDLAPGDLAGLPWILPPKEAPVFIALSKWMKAHRLGFPSGCVQSISLQSNETLLKRYPFIGLMPRSLARGTLNQDTIKVLRLPNATFLPTVWVFHSRKSVNPVVGAALGCVDAVRDAVAEHGTNSSP